MLPFPEVHVTRNSVNQLGLFGPVDAPGAHVVSAHTRLRANGGEVHVAEHLRWNGKRPRRRSGPKRVPAPCDAQADLFTSPYQMVEVELFPRAWQLPLWQLPLWRR